ncbi:hypothetical protein H0H93_012711 [Arthromyces matolae]|nr:hypothetical protein H0H93_012711 [Arthromyces matolae]
MTILDREATVLTGCVCGIQFPPSADGSSGLMYGNGWHSDPEMYRVASIKGISGDTPPTSLTFASPPPTPEHTTCKGILEEASTPVFLSGSIFLSMSAVIASAEPTGRPLVEPQLRSRVIVTNNPPRAVEHVNGDKIKHVIARDSVQKQQYYEAASVTLARNVPSSVLAAYDDRSRVLHEQVKDRGRTNSLNQGQESTAMLLYDEGGRIIQQGGHNGNTAVRLIRHKEGDISEQQRRPSATPPQSHPVPPQRVITAGGKPPVESPQMMAQSHPLSRAPPTVATRPSIQISQVPQGVPQPPSAITVATPMSTTGAASALDLQTTPPSSSTSSVHPLVLQNSAAALAPIRTLYEQAWHQTVTNVQNEMSRMYHELVDALGRERSTRSRVVEDNKAMKHDLDKIRMELKNSRIETERLRAQCAQLSGELEAMKLTEKVVEEEKKAPQLSSHPTTKRKRYPPSTITLHFRDICHDDLDHQSLARQQTSPSPNPTSYRPLSPLTPSLPPKEVFSSSTRSRSASIDRRLRHDPNAMDLDLDSQMEGDVNISIVNLRASSSNISHIKRVQQARTQDAARPSTMPITSSPLAYPRPVSPQSPPAHHAKVPSISSASNPSLSKSHSTHPNGHVAKPGNQHTGVRPSNVINQARPAPLPVPTSSPTPAAAVIPPKARPRRPSPTSGQSANGHEHPTSQGNSPGALSQPHASDEISHPPSPIANSNQMGDMSPPPPPSQQRPVKLELEGDASPPIRARTRSGHVRYVRDETPSESGTPTSATQPQPTAQASQPRPNGHPPPSPAIISNNHTQNVHYQYPSFTSPNVSISARPPSSSSNNSQRLGKRDRVEYEAGETSDGERVKARTKVDTQKPVADAAPVTKKGSSKAPSEAREEGEEKEKKEEKERTRRGPKIGIGHLDLLYETKGEKMICRMCRFPCLNPEKAKNRPPPATYPADARWADLIGHCQGSHPNHCADLEKLTFSQVRELRQRMLSGKLTGYTLR